MSPQDKFNQGALIGSIMFYLLMAIVVISIIVILVKLSKKKSKQENIKFVPEEPDSKWECPNCNQMNSNNYFTCSNCRYKLQ